LDPSDAHKQIPVSTTPLGNGKFRINYVAKEPGVHSVNVFFASQPIPNSPFGVKVAPSNLLLFF
jgi:filamin